MRKEEEIPLDFIGDILSPNHYLVGMLLPKVNDMVDVRPCVHMRNEVQCPYRLFQTNGTAVLLPQSKQNFG